MSNRLFSTIALAVTLVCLSNPSAAFDDGEQDWSKRSSPVHGFEHGEQNWTTSTQSGQVLDKIEISDVAKGIVAKTAKSYLESAPELINKGAKIIEIADDLSKGVTLEKGKTLLEDTAQKVLDDLTVSQKAAFSPYLVAGKAVYDEVSIDGVKAFINTTSKKINDELDEYKKTTGQEASGLRTFWVGLKHGVIESVKAGVSLFIKVAPTVLPLILAAL